jgi:hypothetical protein
MGVAAMIRPRRGADARYRTTLYQAHPALGK